MTRTTNLNLPQWVGSDPVQREDFNEAFATLDEAYQTALDTAAEAFSEDNLPYVLGSFSVPSGEDTGVELVTFPFKPSAILFMNGASISMHNSKVSGCKLTINDVSNNSAGTRYIVTVYLSGNTLKIQSRSSTMSGSAYYMAFR